MISKDKIRNWLNIIFMLMALIGMAVYVWSDKTAGIYVILLAMSIKIVESSMRMIK